MELNQTCLYCCKLAGCPYLSDGHAFDRNMAITLERAGECRDWHPISPWQVETREHLNALAGEVNTLRTLYELPDMVMDDLREGELLARMIEEIPNFAAMRWEDMTVSERRQQLEFQTDDDGNVIMERDKEGNEFPLRRESYQLKSWATLPLKEGGEVGLPLKVAWLWQAEPLIRHILDFEVEHGLIIKDQKTKGKSETTAENTPTERETQSMATTAGRQVRVARTTSTKAPAGKAAPAKSRTAAPPGRTASPPGRVAGKPTGKAAPPGKAATAGRVARPPRKPGAPASIPESAPAGAGFDMTELKTMFAEVLEANNKALINEMRAIAATHRDEITVLHDMAAQTGGQFAFPKTDKNNNIVVDEDGNIVMDQLPQLFPNPDKILAYVLETAYPPGANDEGYTEEDAEEEYVEEDLGEE
jgi:hypothetical protein